MPGPAAWNYFTRPASKHAARRPATRGVLHHKRNNRKCSGRQHHQTKRQAVTLWNGFISLPRVDDQHHVGEPNSGNAHESASASNLHQTHESAITRAGDAPRAIKAPNQRFLARLNNDLKQLWQSCPIENGVYTASTSMPTFSEDVRFSGSLFRKPLIFTTIPSEPSSYYLHESTQLIPTPLVNAGLFESAGHQASTSISSVFRGISELNTSSHFAADAVSEFQLAKNNSHPTFLTVCRCESISIGPLTTDLAESPSKSCSSLYTELCSALKESCRQACGVLYANGILIDLNTLRRRACQKVTSGQAFDGIFEETAYDPCPFSPMTVLMTYSDNCDEGIRAQSSRCGVHCKLSDFFNSDGDSQEFVAKSDRCSAFDEFVFTNSNDVVQTDSPLF